MGLKAHPYLCVSDVFGSLCCIAVLDHASCPPSHCQPQAKSQLVQGPGVLLGKKPGGNLHVECVMELQNWAHCEQRGAVRGLRQC